MKKGFFITFEGADGCGKTTQMNMVADFLEKSGYSIIKTREPGGCALGIKLREILLHYDGVVSDNAEAFLYLADRAQHVETIIKPALDEGKIVLCDRFTDSTIAYQGYGRGIDCAQIKYLNNLATSNLAPDLTLVFDVDSEVAQMRVGKNKDRLEKEGLEFHKNVRAGYLKIAQDEPGRVKVINANGTIDEVFALTKKTVTELIK